MKPNKTKDDFYRFIDLREQAFVRLLGEWGFKPALVAAEEPSNEVVED
jgi:hypothetical protein